MDKDVQNYLVNKIKSEYTEKTNTEFEKLISLDRKIKLPPLIQAYTCGIVGALILGFGMSLIMTDIGAIFGINSSFTVGIIVGILGLAICGINYPLYKKFLETRKNRYSQEILRLADKLGTN